ncbi:MAG: hypothetical protein Q4G08_10430 [Capnocytophaga sp.]|nr:hypothetical protein [Capnocytophaga sp.]
MKKIVAFITIVFLGIACTTDKINKDNPIGPDTIGLSTEELQFGSEGGTQTVTTKGDVWIIHELYDENNKVIPLEKLETEGRLIVNNNVETFTTIRGSWFTIERNLQSITVTLTDNTENVGRSFFIMMSDTRNRHGYLKIIQEKK